MTKHKLPDGPQNGSLLQKLKWITKPLEVLETHYQRYGDIFTAYVGLGKKPIVIISNPQAIQEVFSTDPKYLDSGEVAGIKPPFIGQQSLIALSGDRHKRQRKLLTPPFHGERMLAYGKIIQEITEQVTSQWVISSSFFVRSAMQEITFQVILKAVFGLVDGPRYQKLQQLLMTRLDGTKSLFRAILLLFPILQKDLGPWSPWGRLMENEHQIDQLIYEEIQERRENPDPSRTDILSLMMAARDEAGEPMTDVELRDELITLLVAGHETTATSLSWAFYWIHHQPQVREKLLQELDTLGENPDPNQIFRLPYLDAVYKETLRIYPVAMMAFQRMVLSPLDIAGYHFEPGIILSLCIYLTHHREDLYPEPKKFKPERFLERQFSSSEYLPFGGGSRRCIGMAFAQFEMKLILVTVLSRWQLELKDSKPMLPVRRGLLLAPPNDFQMVVKAKKTTAKAMSLT
ncbi:cytochrome P450 [Crocosphaera sp. XPORK-15E]|uniref:cytochrome P450 n=1 Tax=Crocosphaera sp. XPORK-15E TaxID=3110247 RepID=UPI002B207F7C|nr:cytochrome P450 [Crocosphaera sp. XPORK-15E]MEA5534922.1 cytochrome P450 [Crocosphaera sp. XPORK-15E]